ncbi:MAG: single-stranded-DNA-specific exonuclease RecJ [Bacteroidales bacterium]
MYKTGSVSKKTWVIKKHGNEKEVLHLAEALGVVRPIANLLVQRGVRTFDAAKSFFRPSLDDLHDPFLMKDMDKAVKRLQEALQNNEKILIYGDYDVDGTTSVALLYSFFKGKHENLDYYIPDRYSEGYGISYKGIDYAASKGVTLVIALDCGIKAVKKIEYALDKGIDFIICDHHTADVEIPKAIAVLDPKRPDCNYPFKELSGCGVGFKLLQAYSMKTGSPVEEMVPFLDLVAVSIASDIVPIIGENRVLAYYGLIQLNKNPRTGLKAVIGYASLRDKEITIDDIVFKIGPRINAAGRIKSGKHSVELLASEDEAFAENMGNIINEYNTTRRAIDGNITQEALMLIANDQKLLDKKSTVLFNSKWHKGVIGIVASRLIETYYKPTIVLTESNGFITGSARSVIGFDLYSAIESCGDLLENFGGHMYAAGLTLKKENLTPFIDRFEKIVTESIEPSQLIPQIEIDTEISLADITPKFYRILKQFEPFGPGNMSPVFITENVSDDGTGRKVGANGEHLKLNLIQEDNPFNVMPAIGFGIGSKLKSIRTGYAFDVCYSIDENNYRGTKTLQLRIRDIKTD